MAPFEYLLLFAALVLGLAVCELAIGLNPPARLRRPDRMGLAAVGLSLVFVRNRWWQTAALLGLAAAYFLAFYGRTLL
jgi:hypothetical protein